jgi:cell division transport system ATP-binding protein
MITFHNVCKHYGENKILDNINFQIKPAEFVSIVGASGAGKSTLLHLLLGALRPTSGCVEVDNLIIDELDQETMQLYRRKIGVVFQDYKLLPQKTIFENIAFAMETCLASEKEIELRVPQVMEIVGIPHTQHKFPYELSGGEQQRAALARALVHNPKMILADEPTGNLDPENTMAIMNLLQKINHNGVTIILASHDRDTVNKLNERVIKLERGGVVLDRVGGYD